MAYKYLFNLEISRKKSSVDIAQFIMYWITKNIVCITIKLIKINLKNVLHAKI
jgi:hypothetical protein